MDSKIHKEQVSVSIDPEELSRLREEAHKKYKPLSEHLRDILQSKNKTGGVVE